MMVAVAAVAKSLSVQSWESVCSYQNSELVRAIQKKRLCTVEDAATLFLDLKRYLWLSALLITEKESGQTELSQLKIDDDWVQLDECWHLFLLFTRDYQEFCETYFGFFLHHVPVTEAEIESRREALSKNPQALEAKEKAEFRQMLSWIYDHAGRDTVERWFLRKTYSAKHNQTEL